MGYFLQLEHSSLPSWASKHLLILHSYPSQTSLASALQNSLAILDPPLHAILSFGTLTVFYYDMTLYLPPPSRPAG